MSLNGRDAESEQSSLFGYQPAFLETRDRTDTEAARSILAVSVEAAVEVASLRFGNTASMGEGDPSGLLVQVADDRFHSLPLFRE
ncbi:MAG: hypothetical protein Q8R35_01310 [bacterium]|nr:hypothetical protein [bacterium]